MKQYPLYPFNHYIEKGVQYCVKCGLANSSNSGPKRELCTGKIVLWGPKCPDSEHFHHKCRSCGGKWCEGTHETQKSEVKDFLRIAFSLAEKATLNEEDIIGIWRLRIMKSVMEE